MVKHRATRRGGADGSLVSMSTSSGPCFGRPAATLQTRGGVWEPTCGSPPGTKIVVDRKSGRCWCVYRRASRWGSPSTIRHFRRPGPAATQEHAAERARAEFANELIVGESPTRKLGDFNGTAGRRPSGNGAHHRIKRFPGGELWARRGQFWGEYGVKIREHGHLEGGVCEARHDAIITTTRSSVGHTIGPCKFRRVIFLAWRKIQGVKTLSASADEFLGTESHCPPLPRLPFRPELGSTQ